MKTKILLPKPVKITKKAEDHAIFEIENCYPGYGMTLGNAFRRALISSLPGTAVTSVKIQGVEHEFSTIPNVLEDLVQIMLNLKELRFRLNSEGPVTLTLKAKGEKKVKASDIKVTSDIEIVNKDAYIATLTDKKAKLDMEIEVDSGLGYVPVEQRKQGKLPIGHIAVDALFSPIKRVSYEVENMRVGDRTDFNKLKLDIETDNSITPEQAFNRAAKVLVNHFNIFTEKEEAKPAKSKKSPRKKSPSKKKTTKKKTSKKTTKSKSKKSK